MKNLIVTLSPKALAKMNGDYGKTEIVFRHGHIAITNYEPGDNKPFEYSICADFNDKGAFRGIAGYYIPEIREFRLPRGYEVEALRKYFSNCNFRVENCAFESPRDELGLKYDPKSDMQKLGLDFVTSNGKYQNNKKYTTLYLTMDTGEGKTYTGIAGACHLNARMIIFVAGNKLVEQWRDAIIKFTRLTKDEILVINGETGGVELCDKIRNGDYPHIRAFIFSIGTFRSYVNKRGNLIASGMLKRTKCYLKIIDEADTNMAALMMIDALSNFHMSYYMSATPFRSDTIQNRIYQRSFYYTPKFGQGNDHILIKVVPYTWVPTAEQIKAHNMFYWDVASGSRRFNVKSYEKALIYSSKEQLSQFVERFLIMLRASKRMLLKGNKIFILSGTIDGTEFTSKIAEQVFPENVSRYYGELSQKEKAQALKATVICATDSSLGRGTDLGDTIVQHVYCIITSANRINFHQWSGRARKKDDGTQKTYIELVNMGYTPTYRHYMKRLPFMKQRSCTGDVEVVHF